MTVVRLCAIAVVLAQASCGPPAIDGGFDSANPAAKMYAIEYAARDGDQSAVKCIIEQLSSDDPAVRFMAIGALQRLTGETHDYHYDDPAWKRQLAVDDWVKAANAGTLKVRPETQPADTPSAEPASAPVSAAGPIEHLVGVGEIHG